MNNSAIWYRKDDTIIDANYLFNPIGIYVFQFILNNPVNSVFIIFWVWIKVIFCLQQLSLIILAN